jgi:beta-lactamase class D
MFPRLRVYDRVMSRALAGVWGVLGVCLACGASALPLCTVIAAGSSGRILRQQGDCASRLTPASTFKVPLSLMGFDAGYLTDEHHPALPFREGYVATDPSWKTTVDPSSWITNSVVWYSQQLTLWLGPERLQRYVKRFDYGNQDLSGNPGMNDGLTQAWLDSSLQISPLEQVAFLHRLVSRQLGVSPRAYDMTARLTAVAPLVGGWEVHGKTGTGYRMDREHGGPDLRRQVGWFVGWASRGGRTVVFASVIMDEHPESTRAGPRARSQLLAELPQLLATLPATP